LYFFLTTNQPEKYFDLFFSANQTGLKEFHFLFLNRRIAADCGICVYIHSFRITSLESILLHIIQTKVSGLLNFEWDIILLYSAISWSFLFIFESLSHTHIKIPSKIHHRSIKFYGVSSGSINFEISFSVTWTIQVVSRSIPLYLAIKSDIGCTLINQRCGVMCKIQLASFSPHLPISLASHATTALLHAHACWRQPSHLPHSLVPPIWPLLVMPSVHPSPSALVVAALHTWPVAWPLSLWGSLGQCLEH